MGQEVFDMLRIARMLFYPPFPPMIFIGTFSFFRVLINLSNPKRWLPVYPWAAIRQHP